MDSRPPVIASQAVQSDRTDIDLLEVWRGGDRSAGSLLFERYYDTIARFFANKVGEGDRQELIQRTFLGCVEARDRFRGDAKFSTYLLGIARRQLYKHYDRMRRHGDRFDYQQISVAALDPSPSQVIANHDEQRLLLQALRTIPLDYQIILELIYWESMTAAEAAAVLDLPLGTAKTRIRRGRQLVEHELLALEGGGPIAKNTCTNLEMWARRLRGALAGSQ
ncbi:MAG TPA: sigma-70 family RNA polymerase sigma factor [Nannocystis exedens]|nr:sigma-70 family RNA polymerase sigma factor [Nannocystis exedens]